MGIYLNQDDLQAGRRQAGEDAGTSKALHPTVLSDSGCDYLCKTTDQWFGQFLGIYQLKIKGLVIYMQLSETPKLSFTGVVNANLLIHGYQKCPKYCSLSNFSISPGSNKNNDLVDQKSAFYPSA